eukprot:gnl/MRDRNA2_/MRDRNA2_95079_c0_seq1.p1 gnl/MRDRNA2_/MRDRNA2_95079_c0~~gnl/MRDRNA2_/MRDRNA2_95079_c0_seq1.p1  ORF type:complete len:528 (-),score=96.90 gnl/MRDRNA2_/MRDRNA2_95079_c0_seq1:14-1597(-)
MSESPTIEYQEQKHRRKESPQLLCAQTAALQRIREQFVHQRKAKKQEQRNKLKEIQKKRGHGQNLDLFAEKTRQRIEEQKQVSVPDCASSPADPAKTAEEEQAHQQELEKFRAKTQKRIIHKLWAKLPQIKDGRVALTAEEGLTPDAFAKRRIAVIGAGPVGLWTAMLIRRRYGKSKNRGAGFLMRPDAPEVTVLEYRPEDQHGCGRGDIRIALSANTQNLLGKRAGGRFMSGMALSEIEGVLLRKWRLLSAPGCTVFGSNVSSLEEMAARGFDAVLWAGGRRSLDAETRERLGCSSKVGDAENALVFSLRGMRCQAQSDLEEFCALDHSIFVQQQSGCSSLRVMLRPGLGGDIVAWVWLMGLPADVAALEARTAVSGTGSTLLEALLSVVKSDLPSVPAIEKAVNALQQRVQPSGPVGVRWVEASYWSADHAVCSVPRTNGSHMPVILLGDAACGKPFYTGTTLNQHFWDVAALVDTIDWIDDGAPFNVERFHAHECRYQARLKQNPAFHRGPLGEKVPRLVSPSA